MPGTKKPLAHEKISVLRSVIDAKLHEDGIYEQIRALVTEKAAANRRVKNDVDGDSHEANGESRPQEPRDDDDDDNDDDAPLIQAVLDSDVVQQLLATVKRADRDAAQPTATTTSAEHDQQREQDQDEKDPGVHLYLRLAGGRAFVDQLLHDDDNDIEEQDDPELVGNAQIGQTRMFLRLVVSFQRQRLVSKDVRCVVDPPFDEHFRLKVTPQQQRTNRTRAGTPYDVDVVSPWEALCLIDEPVHLTLLQVTKRVVGHDRVTMAPKWEDTSKELLATHRLDWRRVLCSTLQLVHLPVQLQSSLKVPIGTLDFRADLLQFKRTASVARDATAWLHKDTLRTNTRHHAFYKYAKQWWEEYQAESSAYEQTQRRDNGDGNNGDVGRLQRRQRLVKLFAEDEEGRFRMVSKFLTGLRVPAALHSPSEAARFVSLLPFKRSVCIVDANDAWRSISTFLALGQGEARDHAPHFCSAVALTPLCASAPLRPAVTNDHEFSDVPTPLTVLLATSGEMLFWEPLTGERTRVREPKGARPRYAYSTIDCIFNANQLYANLQPREWQIADCSLMLDDSSAWKCMDQRVIEDLPVAQPPVTLLPPDIACTREKEQQWTKFLKQSVTAYRRVQGLHTRWSDELSFYLLPALQAYELERLYAIAQVENEFFQQSIKRFVPDGHTFRGYPTVFVHETLPEALEKLEEDATAQDILDAHGRSAHFALATRCFAYPEGLVVTWVLLAVSYQALPG
ncbi:TPA: hypothetical protein N0F65_001140 [Lagenidium giganteum]|uniref:CEP76 C2 domain-containing protein n=1 Tax=Lagenidium giganteum TaxID=4803 RepID=A0AAV2YYC3_9STRA|nr:TPA: hypothetical protein N0F65_001140 [Lagenidium giganteum]